MNTVTLKSPSRSICSRLCVVSTTQWLWFRSDLVGLNFRHWNDRMSTQTDWPDSNCESRRMIHVLSFWCPSLMAPVCCIKGELCLFSAAYECLSLPMNPHESLWIVMNPYDYLQVLKVIRHNSEIIPNLLVPNLLVPKRNSQFQIATSNDEVQILNLILFVHSMWQCRPDDIGQEYKWEYKWHRNRSPGLTFAKVLLINLRLCTSSMARLSNLAFSLSLFKMLRMLV